jgi:hypothetical protein
MTKQQHGQNESNCTISRYVFLKRILCNLAYCTGLNIPLLHLQNYWVESYHITQISGDVNKCLRSSLARQKVYLLHIFVPRETALSLAVVDIHRNLLTNRNTYNITYCYLYYIPCII